ncbi:rho GTPase-activating protein SYDE1 [Clupea harengus]|uniref:Rho GTPase-activating protein SYDE1 n=1 Tax=Clupea harengus TaxID=7950 RepID=A0A6P8EZW6_CLUHA|nr:rho GTPase-activating protein SYDE1 [Clupea harengus]
MAEPLLKRTFSRLRGKEKFRRKTDPKLADVQGKTDLAQSSLSSSVLTFASAEVDSSLAEDFNRRTQITVAKKQNWAKQASASRDKPTVEATQSLVQRAQEWENSSGKAQASKPACSQRTLREDGAEGRSPSFEWEAGPSTPLWDSIDLALSELATPSGAGYVEVSTSSSSVQRAGHGAYLQNLDRSSRAWVLSTGKTQASEEASRLLPSGLADRKQGAEGENNIWYNPIPEEEDSRVEDNRGEYGDPWRRRGERGNESHNRPLKPGGPGSSTGSSRGAQCGGGSINTRDVSAEIACSSSSSSRKESPDISQRVQQSDVQAVAGASGSSGGGGGGSTSAGGGPAPSSDNPAPASKKSGASGGAGTSVMDRIKSPGTVRRLSMKMRKLPELRRKLSLRSSRSRHGNSQGGASGGGADEASPPNARKESSNNVISRYHLDSSAPPARPRRRASRARSADKGGYLSDGDSPELLPKKGGPSAPSESQGPASHPLPSHQLGQEIPASGSVVPLADTGSFRLYSLADQPRCAQRMSGLLTVHLVGVEELMRSQRGDASKEVFCAIQVDGVTRARTALLTCRGTTLPLNHTFNLELERARLLKLVVLTPVTGTAGTGQPSNGSVAPTRNRVCGLGAVAIPPLFRGSRCQQLCVRLEPRGLLYVKLTLLEQWEAPALRLSELPPPSVFGVELRHLVDKEGSALPVPLLIQKSVAEIEKRGLKGVGLYRLCGSAAVKKELRDAFERDSTAVSLTEELYPDVNVITGILKDYLRELPSPLITRTLYEVVLEAMSLRPACRTDADSQRCPSTVSLLHCLPEPEKATLTLLLDHLSLVASFCDSNRMTCQNLAVCFGPVLLTPTQESWIPSVPGVPTAPAAPGLNPGRGGRSFAHSEDIASAVDFKRHIEVLHYLLQLWPIPTDRVADSPTPPPVATEPAPPSPPPSHTVSHNALQRRGQRLPLRLEMPQEAVVSRRGRGRMESPPCNRYAGDWSLCGRDFMSGGEADYDEVAGSDSDEEDEEEDDDGGRTQQQATKESWAPPPAGLYVDDYTLDFDAPFTCRLSLKDFDTLISDLERELAKQINICL